MIGSSKFGWIGGVWLVSFPSFVAPTGTTFGLLLPKKEVRELCFCCCVLDASSFGRLAADMLLMFVAVLYTRAADIDML